MNQPNTIDFAPRARRHARPSGLSRASSFAGRCAVALAAIGACRPPGDAPAEPTPDAAPALRARFDPVVTTTTAIVQYTLRFPRPSTHYVEVEAIYPTEGRPSLDVMMPVWTPGSYLIREYARHVERARAAAPSGDRRPVVKVAKNRLRITSEGDAHVVLRYRLYARERTVRTNFVDADHAILAPAATFYADVDRRDRPHRVVVALPDEWPDVAVALPRLSSKTSSRPEFVAEDFDALVDAPILAGTLERRRFEVGGVPHEMVTAGGGAVWDHDRAARDAERIAAATVAFWGGSVPYDRYLFLNVLNEAGGGLEHRASTVLMSSKWNAVDEEGYRKWTGLVTHELFHAWNGKRLRPKALGPFDYERENYVRTLWAVEGFTSYYDNLLRVRAGLIEPKTLLELIGRDIGRMENTPGREVQSLDEASYDAWIKFYRADENASNSQVSYYRKGALLAWVLDARIRSATAGRRSLDDVMRLAYERFSGSAGYTRAELIDTVATVAGAPVGRWLDDATRLARPLDYRPALEWFGLRFEEREAPLPTGDTPEDRQARRDAAWLGVELDERGGQLVIRSVRRGGPAHRAGLNAGDELIGLGGHRVTDLPRHVRRYEPGHRVDALVARRGELRSFEVEVGVEPRREYTLEPDPDASRAAERRRSEWYAGAS